MHLAHPSPQPCVTSNCPSSSVTQSCPLTLNKSRPVDFFDLDSFHMKRCLGASESNVYLIQCKQTKELFVMKVYPYQEGKPHPSFQNEIQFAHLGHPNLIRIKAVRSFYTINSNNEQTDVSFIIQEHAFYGDFCDLLMTREVELNDKLIRTYFHQLIAGLEYIHENLVAHLDIKLENLLITKNCQLQIGDFGLAKPFDTCIKESWGSPLYRAPELKSGTCKDLAAADIYSAGIVLFVLKSGGHFPFLEDTSDSSGEINSQDLYNNDKNQFWFHHAQSVEKSPKFFDAEFRELFQMMISANPGDRPSILQIKRSAWYNKEIYSDTELCKEMTILLNPY